MPCWLKFPLFTISSLIKAEFEKSVRELYRSLKEKTLEYQHGAVLALGHSFGRRILTDRIREPKK